MCLVQISEGYYCYQAMKKLNCHPGFCDQSYTTLNNNDIRDLKMGQYSSTTICDTNSLYAMTESPVEIEWLFIAELVYWNTRPSCVFRPDVLSCCFAMNLPTTLIDFPLSF